MFTFPVGAEVLQFLDVAGMLRLLNSLALALQNKVADLEWRSHWDLPMAQKVFRYFCILAEFVLHVINRQEVMP